MIKSITSKISALLLATVAVTLAGTIVTFGGSLVVLALLQTASTSSYASAEKTSAPLQFVNWTNPANSRSQQR
jgi:hypothetical protein